MTGDVSGVDAVLEAAPGAGLRVWRGDSGLAWRLNPAAERLSVGVADAESLWHATASSVTRTCERGEFEGVVSHPGRVLHWSATAYDESWVVWLRPETAPSGQPIAATPPEGLSDWVRALQSFDRVGAWDYDIRNGRLHWDPRVFKIYEIGPDAAVPQMDETFRYVHVDDLAAAQASWQRSLDACGRYDMRFRLLLGAGRVKHIHSLWQVVGDARGQPLRAVGTLVDDTESVQVAGRHQSANLQLALAAGLMGLSLWRIDLATQRIQANDWGFQLIGMVPPANSGSEASVESLRSAIHPDDVGAIRRAAERATQGIGVVDAEARYRQPDDSYRTLLTRRTAERDEAGRPVALVGVSMDITEQVAARRSAEEAASRLKLITEATGLGIWSVDLAAGSVSLDAQVRRLLGLGAGESGLPALRDALLERVHVGDRRRLAAVFERLARGRDGNWRVAFRLQRPAGRVRWIEGRAVVAQRGAGREAFGVLVDATEQRETQERLRLSEQRAAMAARGAGMAVWERDLATGRHVWDEQMYRLHGLSQDDPRPPSELRRATMHPDDLEMVRQHTEQVITREVEIELEYRVIWPDGSVHWLASRGMVVRNQAGGEPRLLGINWDISARKRSDEMQRDKAAAERANHAKSDFPANMSHEIRTPMNAILGMTHLALKSGLDARQHGYVQKAERAARSLLGLINDILDFSKIEAGKLDIDCRAFSLAEVMDELADLVGQKAQEKGLELLYVLPPGLPSALVGDPMRLRQVLLNLSNNAVKFTDQGEVTVQIEETDRTPDSLTLRFIVQDTGVGIAESQRSGLFQPFVQGDASITRRYGGTGLGLAISRQLVELMHGQIGVDTHPGPGSRFYFSLRFGLPPDTAQPVAPAGPPPELQGVRLLIVDDNAAARGLLCGMARRLGLQAQTAADGWDALRFAALASPPFDLMLIDQDMPGMEGLACAVQLRAGPYGERPIVLMSTSYRRDDLERELGARQVHGVAWMAKPVTPSGLLDACSAALGHALLPDGRHARRREAFAGRTRQWQGARILLVEDNEINQQLAQELLGGVGLAVTSAVDGREALHLLSMHAFDAVLMDCQMPVMDGYEATREIRRNPRWRDLPVIAMTANAMLGDRERALAAGMDDHIAKPIEVDKMFETIARWVPPVQ